MGPGWAEGYVCTKSSGLCLSLACTRNLPEVFGGLNCSPQRGRELGRMQPSTRKPPGLQHGRAGEAQALGMEMAQRCTSATSCSFSFRPEIVLSLAVASC